MISTHFSVVFNVWPDEPVFHAFLFAAEWKTVCGRKVGLKTPLLPSKHVKKFARPCKSCFPGGSS